MSLPLQSFGSDKKEQDMNGCTIEDVPRLLVGDIFREEMNKINKRYPCVLHIAISINVSSSQREEDTNLSKIFHIETKEAIHVGTRFKEQYQSIVIVPSTLRQKGEILCFDGFKCAQVCYTISTFY